VSLTRGVPALVAIGTLLAFRGASSQQQAPSGDGLSLEEAVELARMNNPGYLAVQNDRSVADWNVRQAYGALVPSAVASGRLGWLGTGEESFGSFTTGELGLADQPSIYSSGYSLGLSYQLDWSVLRGPAQAGAARDRTLADIRGYEVALQRDVTLAYLDVLRQTEEVTLAEQELERARFNLRLASAQRDVGTVTALDVQQAEVQVGRTQVTLLQTEQALRTSRLVLNRTMGVALDRPVRPVTTFELVLPAWDEDTLFQRALESNPDLEARLRDLEVSGYGLEIARSSYFPTLSLSAGWSGFTREASSTDLAISRAQGQVAAQRAQCESQNELYQRLANPLPLSDCSRFVFTDADRSQIIASNDVFPFDFQQSPPSASLTLSLPIFQGFSRQRQVEEAKAQQRDANHYYREQELALRADVAIGLGNVRTAYESALIEERNQAFADEQLRLALERYRVGTISFIDLVEAETVKVQADRARLTAIYGYHDAIATLEAVVGDGLRGPTEP
jgi:outer membrane protein